MSHKPTHQYQLRLDRALYHMQCLESEVSRWLEKRPYRVINEFEAESGKKVVRIEVLEPPPAHFSLIVGDCVHNLRSTLDNLIYELAIARGQPSRKVEETLMFPIFRNAKEFTAKGKYRVRGIAPEAQAIIERLQPYNRGYPYSFDPLWTLHELSRRDKHRLPNLILLTPKIITEYSARGGLISDISWIVSGPIEGSAVVARYRPVNNPEAEMDVQLDDTLSVGVGGIRPFPGHLRPIGDNLRVWRYFIIDKVVAALRPFL